MKVIDLAHLEWGTSHNGGISYGCYYKASEVINGVKYYYKCSNYYSGQGVFGDEAVYEVICSRLLSHLGFNCVNYSLVLAKVAIKGKEYVTYVSKSPSYFVGYDSRVSFEDLHDRSNKSIYDMVHSLGIAEDIKDLFLVDFLTIQRDRHGKNIELLYKDGVVSVAPIFDNGISFLAPYPSCDGKSVKDFNTLKDCPVNNYIGTRSLYDNLKYIVNARKVNKLSRSDKSYIFHGLEGILPDEYLDKVWEIIVYRYMFLKKGGLIVD